ncbi:hypothetical protein VTO42DRAFT_397 [Malbranchea cinnamomea]
MLSPLRRFSTKIDKAIITAIQFPTKKLLKTLKKIHGETLECLELNFLFRPDASFGFGLDDLWGCLQDLPMLKRLELSVFCGESQLFTALQTLASNRHFTQEGARVIFFVEPEEETNVWSIVGEYVTEELHIESFRPDPHRVGFAVRVRSTEDSRARDLKEPRWLSTSLGFLRWSGAT